MHESTMTESELEKLERDVFQFHTDNSGKQVVLDDAAKHFKNIGYTLTRPIEHTLQVYGVVERDNDDPQAKYPYRMTDKFWTISEDEKSLCPSTQA